MKAKPTNIQEPYTIESENMVLGGLIMDGGAFKAVSPIVNASDFYRNGHALIFTTMTELQSSGAVIDLASVSEALRSAGNISKIGGVGYLSELADGCPSVANITWHAKNIKEKADLRRAIEAARDIAIRASTPGVKPQELPTRLLIDISHDAEVSHVEATIKSLNNNIERGYPGLFPGYKLLEGTIRKLVPGHLVIVGAYTSVGKSAFLCDLICRLYRHGMENPGVAIFSTEMSNEQYILRMLANHTGIPTWVISENKCGHDQIGRLVQAQVFFSKCNLYLYDRLYKIEDIERTARLLKEMKGLDVLCIDYIQNLWGDGTIYERMSKLSPVLQYLSKELQITIIALSQVSNEHVKDKGNSGVFGYKGAGEIAASADLAIDLERDKADKKLLYFRVSKNRHGKTGEGCLEYVNHFTRFEETVMEENGG